MDRCFPFLISKGKLILNHAEEKKSFEDKDSLFWKLLLPHSHLSLVDSLDKVNIVAFLGFLVLVAV